ncbi:uncharacterized protein LOC116207864 [Punica granatum]|uniref:Uncharacterized protein n=2 Tax=Punica granatum TaxID=22663 RepID=A0A218XDJ3_PUNGR|nr:uncharacterized protein LOC116207864 [Punica granatum]OWM82412.1 hypothetical protein CDL15_Pgr001986 [Punica granatum]PKI65150.1 hypothetical protein CRG98_014464 [Punica granatum]
MSDHPRLSNLRSTAAILKTAYASFNSNPVLFLFLSLLLFSFRSFVETGSHLVISYIDRDPTLRSLLSRLDLSSSASPARHQIRHDRRPRHRPFPHLTRVGTLDDDLFSEATASDLRSPFSTRVLNPPNGTLVILSDFRPDSGFSPNVVDNGIRFQEIVRPGIKLKVHDSLLLSSDSSELDDKQNVDKRQTSGEQEFDRAVDLQFFIKGLEMGHREAAAFFFLISFLSAAYGWVILGFLVTYSWAFGAVFVAVVNDLQGRFSSLFGVLWEGSRLGLRRLSGFILMRWAVRDTLTQLLGLWFFGEIEDQYSFFKLFVRLKLMPFSVMLPWVRGFDREISWFLFAWFLIDTVIAYVFALDAWIAIVDSRKSGREIVKEGCYLVLTMFSQAVQLKCLEAILCGTFVRWVLARVLGRVFASVVQSTMEVYFMVVWLFFYLSTRCRDANSEGRRFELRELEAAFRGVR